MRFFAHFALYKISMAHEEIFFFLLEFMNIFVAFIIYRIYTKQALGLLGLVLKFIVDP